MATASSLTSNSMRRHVAKHVRHEAIIVWEVLRAHAALTPGAEHLRKCANSADLCRRSAPAYPYFGLRGAWASRSRELAPKFFWTSLFLSEYCLNRFRPYFGKGALPTSRTNSQCFLPWRGWSAMAGEVVALRLTPLSGVQKQSRAPIRRTHQRPPCFSSTLTCWPRVS